MQRIKKTFYISLIAHGFAINPAGSLLPVFNIYTKQAYSAATKISAEAQSAITKNEQTNPTLVQPIDAMTAFVLVYLNLVQENPGDFGVKKDLTMPIVQRLLTKAESQYKINAYHLKK